MACGCEFRATSEVASRFWSTLTVFFELGSFARTRFELASLTSVALCDARTPDALAVSEDFCAVNGDCRVVSASSLRWFTVPDTSKATANTQAATPLHARIGRHECAGCSLMACNAIGASAKAATCRHSEHCDRCS